MATILNGMTHLGILSSDVLTPREHDILRLIAEGKINGGVADSLGITRKIAETHRANIMSKLGIHNVTDLVRYALRNRIVAP
jgi:DNA-binding CsgD family transcriptional regulator